MQKFLNKSFKIPVNKASLDEDVQASATQHKAELLVRVNSLKKENKKLVINVKSLQSELNHASESYIYYGTRVNPDMKVLLSGTNKDKELLRKKT